MDNLFLQTCSSCGKRYNALRPFCSRTCMLTRVCGCGKTYVAHHKKQYRCSKQCRIDGPALCRVDPVSVDKIKEKVHSMAKGVCRSEFKELHPQIYRILHNNHWLEEIFKDTRSKSHSPGPRIIYAYTFSDGYAYVGVALERREDVRKRWHEVHKSPVRDHAFKTGTVPSYHVVFRGVDGHRSAVLERRWIKKLGERFVMLNSNRGGSLGGHVRNSLEDCQRDAALCQTRKEWKDRFSSTHHTAHKQGWFEQCCAHMKRLRHPSVQFGPNRKIHVIVGAPGAQTDCVEKALPDLFWINDDSIKDRHLMGCLEIATTQHLPIAVSVKAKPSTLTRIPVLDYEVFVVDTSLTESRQRLETDGCKASKLLRREIQRFRTMAKDNRWFIGSCKDVASDILRRQDRILVA